MTKEQIVLRIMEEIQCETESKNRCLARGWTAAAATARAKIVAYENVLRMMNEN